MSTLAIDRQLDQVSTENFDIFAQIQNQAIALTRSFIGLCQSVYIAKMTSDRKELQAIKESLGWADATASAYAKVGGWIKEIDPYNLELLDVNTIKSLCAEKFLPIWERLKTERLTVAEVREEMQIIKQATKKPKAPKPKLEWKRNKEGGRSLTLNDIDEPTGMEIEAKFKAFGINDFRLFIQEILDNWQPGIYRVRQMGEEDYIWVEGCKLQKVPNPPVNQWYVFATPEGEIIKVCDADEFMRMNNE